MESLALTVFLLCAGALAQSCGENEQYTTCGTACEPSCDKPQPGICTLQCVIGCQCKQGFFRNRQRKCVSRYECPNLPPISGTTRNARSLTCANMKCREGYHCEQERIQCFVPPCPQPPPKCVPNGRTTRSTDVCANHQCPPGQRCYPQQVQCIRAPCPPIPVCK